MQVAATQSEATDRRILGLFGKFPEPGKVKTRLATTTSAEWAACVADAFLRDSVRRLGRIAAERWLVYTPVTQRSYFDSVAESAFHLQPQRDGDLGQRMAAFFRSQLVSGTEKVVLVGSDSPTVPLTFVDDAFEALDHADIVLGPATDGGYYLVGCSGQVPLIFDSVRWGTSHVLEDTTRRLENTRYRLALLPPWYDVDDVDDWHLLRGHLAALKRSGQSIDLYHIEAVIRDMPQPTQC